MKIAIVVGHNAKAQGAVRVTDGRTEFDWNGHLAELIRAHDPDSIKIFTRTSVGGYSAEIDRVYKETDAWGADCTIELHFNGSSLATVAGCETLTSGTTRSLALANILQERIVEVCNSKNRGVVKRARHDRGGRSLWQGKAPAAMLEPYFGSNASECALFEQNKSELAEAIYRSAVEFLGGKVGEKKLAMLTPVNAPATPRELVMQAKMGDIARQLRLMADQIDPKL